MRVLIVDLIPEVVYDWGITLFLELKINSYFELNIIFFLNGFRWERFTKLVCVLRLIWTFRYLQNPIMTQITYLDGIDCKDWKLGKVVIHLKFVTLILCCCCDSLAHRTWQLFLLRYSQSEISFHIYTRLSLWIFVW